MNAKKLIMGVCLVLVASSAGACGTMEPDAEPLSPEGVWRATVAGERETTLRISADGSFERVEADLALESCEASLGTWSLRDGLLVVTITSIAGRPATEQGSYEVEVGALRPVSGGFGSFQRVTRMATCVDYGWGAWVGTVQASIDGIVRSFDRIEVEIDIERGVARVASLVQLCDSCAFDTEVLVLSIDAATGPLLLGSYTVQNVPGAVRTFFGFFHPDPGNPGFQGFNTDRLSPPGQLVLTGIAPDHVAGTFSFRGNPIVDGEAAPDGATSTEVAAGVVDLSYR